MTAPAKFLFQNSFERVRDESAEVRKPSFNLDELEAAKQVAYADGFAQGLAESRASNEQAISSSLKKLEINFDQFLKEMAQKMSHLQTESGQLAFAIARKFAGNLIERQGVERIKEVLCSCLEDLRNEPQIIVRAQQPAIEALKAVSTQLANDFPNKILFLSDDRIEVGDCKIEWTNGGIELSQSRIEAALASILSPLLNGEIQ